MNTTRTETLGLAENRYSGIPSIYLSCKNAGLKEPKFSDERGNFKVTFFAHNPAEKSESDFSETTGQSHFSDKAKSLLEFCKTPKTRRQIVEFLAISSEKYALKKYLEPLVESGRIQLGIPESPRSRNQTYVTKQME